MQKLKDEGKQIDSVVTDPPYHLTSIVKRFGKEGSAPAQYGTDGAFSRASTGFMGKEWDGGDIAFRKDTWKLAYDLLKPGGYLLAFSASKNYHRMAVAIEDAGFEIRDQIMWLYGSGFPKSLNIGKAIDKKLGNEREVVGKGKPMSSLGVMHDDNWQSDNEYNETKGNSEYEGWGTALKPAHEPIVLARKPISEKSVADNVLKYGTGAINIDGCRIQGNDIGGERKITSRKYRNEDGVWTDENSGMDNEQNSFADADPRGRFPANVMHSGLNTEWARYFYCPKVSQEERNKGLDHLPTKKTSSMSGRRDSHDMEGYSIDNDVTGRFVTERKNIHPTVKPIELMKYLCRLVTPKGGTVLDPFMGSGSTGIAAKDEGFDFIGIEKEEEYFEIAQSRIKVTSPLMEFMG